MGMNATTRGLSRKLCAYGGQDYLLAALFTGYALAQLPAGLRVARCVVPDPEREPTAPTTGNLDDTPDDQLLTALTGWARLHDESGSVLVVDRDRAEIQRSILEAIEPGRVLVQIYQAISAPDLTGALAPAQAQQAAPLLGVCAAALERIDPGRDGGTTAWSPRLRDLAEVCRHASAVPAPVRFS